ncbi:MAG TPA: MFS transporter, partial [Atribacterota bacterium]|nr:MFS transporter [Atribacterota bacterium]
MLKTVLILFLSYTTVGLCNNGFFSILPFLSEEFAISRVQIGYYSAFYFTSAALLALFSGNIVDRFGPKRSILWGMGCMGLTLFCYGWSTSYQLILFLAIFAGLGMSILTPSVVKGTSIIAPPEKQALFLGLVQAGYSVGSIIAPAILPVLALNFSWQISIQITAILTLLI